MSWPDHSDDKDNPGGKLRSRIGFSTQTGTRRKAGQPTRAEWKRKGTRPALCCVKNGVRLNLERGWLPRVDNGGAGSPVRLNDQWAS